MEITIFHWSNNNGPSITRSFEPYIDKLKEDNIVHEYRVPYNGANPINIIRNIYFVYKHKNKYGINHITGDIHYCILGLLSNNSVLTIHDDYAIIKAPNIFNKIYKWLFWIYLPIKLSKAVVCITQETKNKIEKLIPSASNISVITQHSVDNFPYREKTFNKDYPRILQIGTTEQKNLESTLKALHGIPCKLVVIKEMTTKQLQLAKELNIDFINRYNLSDQEILDEYYLADIVLFPSLYEGFGMPIIEAQATGRAIITSDLPPMNWVAGNNAALLKTPTNIKEYRNLIYKIINDSMYRESIIEHGLNNVKRFNINNIKEEYMSLYNNIINNSKK